jgi:hypothetical protein
LAQKSLPVLNKVGTSMVWYTTFFYKYYKWLSSQSIYLLYFINKLFVYTDFIFSKLLWISFYSTNLYKKNLPTQRPFFKKKKFFKPLTCYIINTGRSLSIVNIFYKTTLENFQELSKRTDEKKKKTINLNFDKKFKNIFFC